MRLPFKFMACVAFSTSLTTHAFDQNPDRGWWFYKEQPMPKTVRPAQKTVAPQESLAATKPPTARDQIKKIQDSFEEATARAILEPSLPNVQKVLTLQRQMMDRADALDKTWMLASLFENQHRKPQDSTHPVARDLYQKERESQLKHKIRALSKTTGLFFAVSSSCSHCHAFAPIVKDFVQEYGFEIKVISKEGTPLKEFPEVSKDNGVIHRLNPKGIYPALFLAHPATGHVIPVAWGMTDPDELLENFATVIKALEENTFHVR